MGKTVINKFKTAALCLCIAAITIGSGTSVFAGGTINATAGSGPDAAALANALNATFGGTTGTFASDFVTRFLDPEAKNLAKTNVMGALMSHPTSDATIKSGVLPGFMVGATGGVAGGLSEDVQLNVGGSNVNFPLAAGVVGFNAYGGINLGLWGLGFPNIDVMLVSGGGSFGRKFGNYTISGSSVRGGFLVRYHVINPINLILVKFLGLSVGAGYMYQNIDFTLARDGVESITTGSGFGTVTWSNRQSIGFKTSSSVIPIQAQTGVTLFWILNLHAGVGYAYASGNTEVGYKNEGVISGTIGSNTSTANMLIDYTGKASATNTKYIFGGGEINIFMIHIGAEGIWNYDKAAGLSIYARFQW